MLEFCGERVIKQEFSYAKDPPQHKWGLEAVNTACIPSNRFSVQIKLSLQVQRKFYDIECNMRRMQTLMVVFLHLVLKDCYKEDHTQATSSTPISNSNQVLLVVLTFNMLLRRLISDNNKLSLLSEGIFEKAYLCDEGIIFGFQQLPDEIALCRWKLVEDHAEELLEFKLQQVWVLVDLPNGAKVIGTKWVYRNKKDERGVLSVKQSRGCSSRFIRQEEVDDFDEVVQCLVMDYTKPLRAWYATLSNIPRRRMDQVYKSMAEKEGFLHSLKEVTSKTSHLNDVKRIFKYPQGQTQLGLMDILQLKQYCRISTTKVGFLLTPTETCWVTDDSGFPQKIKNELQLLNTEMGTQQLDCNNDTIDLQLQGLQKIWVQEVPFETDQREYICYLLKRSNGFQGEAQARTYSLPPFRGCTSLNKGRKGSRGRKGKEPMTEEDLQAESSSIKDIKELKELADLEEAKRVQKIGRARGRSFAREALAMNLTTFSKIKCRSDSLLEKIQKEEREHYSY
ncbi:hypothetical protein Tco_0287124 [Tanacetum coccineum]